MRLALVLTIWLALLPPTPPLAGASEVPPASPAPGSDTLPVADAGGSAAVTMGGDCGVVELAGKPVPGSTASEIEVRQDAPPQVIRRLGFDPSRQLYTLEYTPRSG